MYHDVWKQSQTLVRTRDAMVVDFAGHVGDMR